ncbi:ATP-binding cassette sub-family A member 10 [Hyalella azteca]|uniref:ATP-binding cassette sub-family A member 10 n=1 Tax=Hyalella azteca TaxID=294128 RepID=A0A8B7P603_HYAAZ|nr:ATP-binding cassette sub-family A member 10 [Hyalella azteca]
MTGVLVLTPLLPLTHPVLVFLLLLFYGLNIVALCYLLGELMESSLLALLVGVTMTVLGNVPFVMVSLSYTHLPLHLYIILSLLAPSGFGFGFRVLCQYEMAATSATFQNLFVPPTVDSEMTSGYALLMLLLDACLLLVLTLLLQLCRVGYRRCFSPKVHSGSSERLCGKGSWLNAPDVTAVKNIQHQQGCVRLSQVRYAVQGRAGRGGRTLLEGVTLDLKQGHVTALLGHNGAGKTTLIWLGKLGFGDHGDQLCCHLSEGLCQQLAVAVAFLGSSQLVLLDEPTAGVDPTARRAIWQLVQLEKTSRVVVVATHFLDEAEMLADVVIVVDHGRVVGQGPPWELKRQLGPGLRVNLVRGEPSVTICGRVVGQGSPWELKRQLGPGLRVNLVRGEPSVARAGLPRTEFMDRSHRLAQQHQDGASDRVLQLVQQVVPECSILRDTAERLTLTLPHPALGESRWLLGVLVAGGEPENLVRKIDAEI